MEERAFVVVDMSLANRSADSNSSLMIVWFCIGATRAFETTNCTRLGGGPYNQIYHGFLRSITKAIEAVRLHLAIYSVEIAPWNGNRLSLPQFSDKFMPLLCLGFF